MTVTQIRFSGVARAGLLATCKRGDAMYELSLADVVFSAASGDLATREIAAPAFAQRFQAMRGRQPRRRGLFDRWKRANENN